MARARSPLTMEGVEISSLSSPHVNMSISNHSTTRKSWRSDAPIILPGWECHTGGSRSKPTVHRCRPKTGGCGLLTRTQNEPTKKQHSLSLSRMLMSYQFTDKIRDLGFPHVSITEFIGGQVRPNSLMSFWI